MSKNPHRLAALFAPVAFAVLAATLAGIGAVPRIEAVLATTSVALVFVATGWWAASALRRRLAELVLVPAAFAMTMVGGAGMRRMVLPPLLLLAIWAAMASAWDRVPERQHPALAVLLGLAARAAVGVGLSGFGSLSIAFAVAVAAVLPWMACRRWGRRAAELGALLGAVLPWQCWPFAAAVLLVVCLGLGLVRRFCDRDEEVLGWVPGVGAGTLFVAALASWPGAKPSIVFPEHGWPAWVALVVALAVTTRLRPGVSGAVWLAASLCLGPVVLPSPEQRAFQLTPALGELRMSAGTGGDYVLDLDVENREAVADGTPLAVLRFAGDDHVIFAGEPGQEAVWRPHGLGAGNRWRASNRSRFTVPEGERPVLLRHPDLPDEVALRVDTIGAVRATPPRDWFLPRWLLATAAWVAVIQIASGTWRSGIGVLPWLILVLGSLAARAPVEPLRLIGERLAVVISEPEDLNIWIVIFNSHSPLNFTDISRRISKVVTGWPLADSIRNINFI